MNLLIKLLEILRGISYSTRDSVIFALQLLAWGKLSQEDKIPDYLKINDYLDLPDYTHFIVQVFNDLRHNTEILENNSPAFEQNNSLFSSVSGSILRELINTVAISFKDDSLSFDALIDSCMRLDGKANGEYFLPSEVTDLVIKLGEIKKADEVYCPFDGSLRMAFKSNYITPKVNLEIRMRSPFPYLLNILFDRSVAIKTGNPISEPQFILNEQLQFFDVALANPPFGMRYSESEVIFLRDRFNRFPENNYLYGDILHIRHILAQIKKRAVVIVSDGLLFRTTAGEKEFKRNLMEEGLIKAVISLPSGLLSYANISFSVIILDKENLSDSILFIDASSEHFYEKRRGKDGTGLGRNKLVNIDEIITMFRDKKGKFLQSVSKLECAENEYNLLPQRYVSYGAKAKLDTVTKDTNVKLEDLVEFIRPQTLKDYITEDGEECFEVSVSDIGDDGIIKQPEKKFYLSPQSIVKNSQYRLLPEDILLTVKGSTGKVGLVPKDLAEIWFANQSFLVLRMRYNKDFENPAVLFRYLASPIGQLLLERLVGGTSVSMLQTKDIKALPVLVPSARTKTKILKDHEEIVSIYEEIQRLRETAEMISKKHWQLD